MTHQPSIILFACLLMAVGCGAQIDSRFTPPSAAEGPASLTMTAHEASSEAASSETALPDGRAATAPPVARRHIIYRAEVDLVVERFEPLPEQIETAVRERDGFVSASSISGSPGQPRSGRWTVRIPVDRFGEFLAAVRELGEVRSIASTSDDVTAEFYDIEARIRNKQQEEERLLKLLAEATGKLEEVLAVERELSRVRGEIEQVQGRLRMLKDVTELTTVTVTVTEIENYVPEQAPTYLTRVRRAFAYSTSAAIATAQTLSLMAVALVPWLPVPLVLVLAIWAFRRRRRAR
jgi:hypothetical protein